MAFKKVERSYYSTPNGWRLATFEEVQDALEMIKKENILNKWDRVRLLDGWITGSGYNFEMGNDFKGCLGYMLLIQTKASVPQDGAYADVRLTEGGKEVALFLCVDDWNYEVVYWLLNSWSKSQTMNMSDVSGGNIPFRIGAKFEKMNKLISYVARRLGAEGGKALEKARDMEDNGKDSIKEMLSGMIKIVTKEEDIIQFVGPPRAGRFRFYEGDEYCLPDSIKAEGVAEALWSFVCDSFAGYVVEVCAFTCLRDIREMKTRSTSHDNMLIATSILLHLSDYRTDVIHEPMAHDCKGSCAQKIIIHAEEKAAGSSELFNEMLRNNAMWRSYGETGKYGVLDKLLVLMAKPKHKNTCEAAEKVVEMLMQCGARPGGQYAFGKYKNKTVLHSAAKFPYEGGWMEISAALIPRHYNNEQTMNEFVNAADDRGMTALHIASERGNLRMCELLVDRGTVVTAQDKKGMTALHYALEGGIDNVIDVGTEIAKVLLRSCHEQSLCEFVNAADESGMTALHIASKKANAYICEVLVDGGAAVTTQDNKGMTALHYTLDEEIDEVLGLRTEIAQALLRSCDEQRIYEFVNAPDKERRTALHYASKKGYTRVCGLLVERGALVNAQDKKDMTALHYAFIGEISKVKFAGTEIAQALLGGCDEQCQYQLVNVKDENGRTALHYASEKGNVRSCGLFIERGALVNVQDKMNKTALHYAFGGIDKDVGMKIAQNLLHSCDRLSIDSFVNAIDEKGRTALHYASENGNARMCKMLVEHGASVTVQDNNGMTALHCALTVEIHKIVETEIVKALLDRYHDQNIEEFINVEDKGGKTALHAASEKGDVDACKLLLDRGASVIAKDEEGKTALHYVFKSEIDNVVVVRTEITKALLARCDKGRINEFVNAVDERGRTALHSASEKGDVAACKLLLDCGASLTARDGNGMTALHYAFEGGNDKVIDVEKKISQILVYRCDKQTILEFVNSTDKKGRTALHGASEKGSTRTCELLVDQGAVVTVQDKMGMTALHYAFKGGNDKDIQVMAEIAKTLLLKCDEQSEDSFVNATDEERRAALHYASANGYATICELLVQHGASTTLQDVNGMTALHYACEGGIDKVKDVEMKIAQALLRRSDEQSIYEFVNAKDCRNRTALHIASNNGNACMCELLVKHGSLMTVQDKVGMTALHYALLGGIDEVIDVLVKSPRVTDSLNLKNRRGYTPLEIALGNMDYRSTGKLLLKSEDPKAVLEKAFANMDSMSTAKLLENSKESEDYSVTQAYLDRAVALMDCESTAKFLSKSKQPEAYFNKVDQEQLLRYSLFLGFEDMVYKLLDKGINLPAGDCDEDGKTALHLAAMCDSESIAIEIVCNKMNTKTSGELKDMLAKQDKGGRTVLHEAALKKHEMLCLGLLQLNSELIYVKDLEGRNPLYDAVVGQYKSATFYDNMWKSYQNKDMGENDLMDRSGLTPLHVAASQGEIQVVKDLLSRNKFKRIYLSRGDNMAQTALHKAVKRGYIDTVGILLKHGAHPLRERDRDGRTALHYATQAEPERKIKLATMLLKACQSDSEKLLLLWASAAGIGTAEQDLKIHDPLLKFLSQQKEWLTGIVSFNGNLLKLAISLGDVEMMKELISRGYQIGHISEEEWKRLNRKNFSRLQSKQNQDDINKVLGQIKMIKQPGHDKPTLSDSLGRLDYAQGLAALFMNPYIKPPIAVGISGPWGTGKSSLMLQTERILLTTASQMALFPSLKLSSSASELPDIKRCELSKKGEGKCEYIYRHIKREERVNRNIFVIVWDYIKSKIKHTRIEEIQKELVKFLNNYNVKYLKVFKAIAAMDSSDMSRPKPDPSAEESLQAVLTVQYNAWKYRNDTEALAGIAVEITKELEGIMSHAQWLNTCWRNTWKKNKYTLWIEIFFPSILALVLASSFTWIVWVVFDSDKLKEWGKAKYAWPPALIVIIVWTLTKAAMGILKPVSTQLLQSISFPDHTDKLGYQERVISDITFLKDEIGKKAYWVFVVFSWLITTFTALMSLLFHFGNYENTIEAPKLTPAPGSNLRIIVFVDDLDRCQESVILQVLSAVNLVLAVCEISVVIGMDKRLIERAIIKKYKDVYSNKSLQAIKDLADVYLQKIIQLPLDLPDPSDEESRRFLKGQWGASDNDKETSITDDWTANNGSERSGVQQTAAQITITMETTEEIEDMGYSNLQKHVRVEPTGEAPAQRDGETGNETNSPSMLVREMLFIRYYSKGEEDAFLYFQGLATDCRKHPREWKRLLNYHRLVWYIFSVNKEAKNLVGWQVQLITWIFVCWEWQDYMNLVIKKWKEIDLKTEAPSLVMIVKHLMEEHNGTIHENSENGSSDKLVNSMKNKLDELEKSLAELKKEMKELNASDESRREVKELENLVSMEMKEDIKEVKEQISKMENGKNEKKRDEKNRKSRENWERMRSTLEKYDVSMDGIQAFQRFRFYCIAGYLPRLGL